jgi:cytochrome P450
LQTDVLTWVARLSSRIFNGEELTRNEDWLRISKDYTVNTFTALAVCKFFPAPFRWLAERALPLCRKVRRDRAAGARILAPILAARKAEIAAAKREGREPNLPDDSIEWFRKAAKGRAYNDCDLQLGLSIAAIHTTSDLLGQALLNLGAHPEMVDPLRKEAVEVLGKYGWQKVALAELRILDSFLKETQRLKPIAMGKSQFCEYKASSTDRLRSIHAPACN